MRSAGIMALLLGLLMVPRASADTHLLFSLRQPHLATTPRELPGLAYPEQLSTTIDDGAWRIQLTGQAGAGALVRLPIDRFLQAPGQLAFSVRSKGLAPIRAEPASLLLVVEEDGQQRTIDLFAPTGEVHEELGQIALTPADGAAMRIIGVIARVRLLDAGDGELTVQHLRLTAQDNLHAPAALKTQLEKGPGATAELRRLHPQGSLQLIVDERLAGNLAMTAEAGISLAGVPVRQVSLALGGSEQARPLFPFPGYMDRQALRERLADAPPGLLLLELRLWEQPPWFAHGPPSAFNDAWMNWCRNAIDEVLALVWNSPERQRVIGVTLSLSRAGGAMPWESLLQDPQGEQHFREWLLSRYATLSALRTAWRDPDATFETATLAPQQRWPGGDVYALIHPASSARGADSWRFFWSTWATLHERLAEHLATRAGHPWLIGVDGAATHFMNPWTGGRAAWPAEALLRLLDSPAIDCLLINASPGATAGFELLLSDAADRQDKLLVVRAPWQPAEGSRDAIAEALGKQRRLLGANLVAGAGTLLAPQRRPVPATLLSDDLPGWQDIAQRAARVSANTNAQIAFVIDPRAYEWLSMRPDDAGLLAALLALPRLSWPQLGAPYDVVFIDDLQPEKYRLIVFHPILRHTPERTRLIERCRGEDRVLLWLWSGGVVGQEMLSPRLTSEWSGIGVQWRPRAVRFFLQPQAALIEELSVERVKDYFGWTLGGGMLPGVAGLRVGPMFTIRDEQAQILANYADLDEPAVALRQYPTHTSVYSATPYVNAELLRALLERANGHVYVASDAYLQINDSFILIHPRDDGPVDIRLPYESSLYEVFRQQELEPADSHYVDLKGGRTYLFYRGSWERWINLSPPQ